MENFAALAPEVNSGRIYGGAGAAPMLAAAATWGSLSEQLASAASSFISTTSELTSQSWQGPAAEAMLAAAAPYVGFLSAAAAQAAGAAEQANSVTAVFEAARAASVHPQEVTANRCAFKQLVNSNIFGLNAPAIMAVEATYEAMWAADVAAMTGYHVDVSAAAAQLEQLASATINALSGLSSRGIIIIGNQLAAAAINASSGLSTRGIIIIG